MSNQQPNVLIIMVDQLAASFLPSYGHSVVKAPHISALAEKGVQFNNAYCNSPLCAPSRFSFMTGRLPSKIGAYDNAAYHPSDIPTMAHYMRHLGYQTSLVGKMHFIGPDQLHGFEERLTTDIYPADFGWTPDWEQPEKRPSWYHNMLSVAQAGTCETSNQLEFDDEVAFHTTRKIFDLARGGDERPFFLISSFTHPHDPFAITQEYWDRYDHDDIDMPTVPQIRYDELDPHSQRLYKLSAMDDYAQTEERIRTARHAYYGMISYIDDQVGKIVDALERTNQLDNTIIVFTADHGEMLGERGLWYKMSFFENSAQVPLIVAAPNYFESRWVNESVSLVDILPTLTDIGSLGEFDSFATPLDGDSLIPLLVSAAADPDRTAYGEHLGEGAIAPLVMIRRGRYKYVYSEPDPDQLYDLVTDPHEQNNLATQEAHADLRQSFYDEMQSKWDLEAIHADVLASQKRRRLIDRALREGKHTPWEFEPRQNAANKYMRNHLDLNEVERKARYPTPEVPQE